MTLCEKQNLNVKLIKHSKHNIDKLTFLKSNYKYKRRYECSECECTEGKRVRNKCECVKVSNAHYTMQHTAYAYTYAARKSDKFTFRLILRFFIVILENLTQYKMPPPMQLLMHDIAANEVATTMTVDTVRDSVNDGDVNGNNDNNDVNKVDCVDETNYQQNYDKVPTISSWRDSRNSYNSTSNNSNSSSNSNIYHSASSMPSSSVTSTSLPSLWQYLDFSVLSSSTASSTPSSRFLVACAGHTNVLSILMTLFMAIILCVRNVEAGACWQTALNNGKCNEIFSLNITKVECCGKSQEFFYTDHELNNVEYFFAITIGGGMECTPCIDSCKHMKCGSNKKCVKRKGRPKCICAPECGAALRQKKREKKHYRGHHQIYPHSEHYIRIGSAEREIDLSAASDMPDEAASFFEKSPRDIRSLSSEITNVNLELNGAPATVHQDQISQRKILLMQSQSQEKPHIYKREPKPKRLLITSNVEHTEKPTTRRLQIISNVRRRNKHNHNSNTNNNNSNNRTPPQLADETADKESSDSEGAARGSAMSRHKSNHKNRNKHRNRNGNGKNPNNKLELIKNQQQNDNDNNNNNHNYNENDDDFYSNNNGRIRHIHQNGRQVELENVPNHALVEAAEDKHHERHHYQQQQFQRKHHKHHNNREKQKQKLKDHHNNANSTTAAVTAASTATSSLSTWPSSADNATAITMSFTAAATTTRNTYQTTTTPVNSTSSADHRLLNHGSNFATSSSSSSPSSSASSATSTIHLANAGARSEGVAAVSTNRADSSNSVNSDDLTFLDGIYDKFSLHGFPNQHHALMQIENMHNVHPVCGTDGRTYNTECQLRKRACRTDNPNLQVAYRGHCKTTCNGVKCLNGLTCVEDHYTIPHCIVCKIDCPQDDDVYASAADGAVSAASAAGANVNNDNDNGSDRDRSNVIDPSRAVCGVDGKTYKSTCDINRMICKIGRAIAVAYPGPCRADRITCNDINCGPKHTCLVDLLTHEPRCISCRYKCARKRRPTNLRFEEGKICGVNNRTYNSWCEMRKDSCATGFLIDIKAPGECQ